MQLDEQLPELADTLIAESDLSARIRVMRRQMPRFLRHLERVATEQDVLARWGLSKNFDEVAMRELVSERILELIESVTGVPMFEPACHAGLQHTYGYLLSLIETPFGYKRSRWLSGTIERGFDLPTGSLQAFPRRGTLLSNLTVFLSHFSLDDQPKPTTIGVTSSFHLTHRSSFAIRRIVESICSPAGSENTIHFRTDLVPFPRRGEPNPYLLIYTIQKEDDAAKLITAFPVGDAMCDELTEPSRFGDEQSITLRFNGFVDGFPREGLVGTRRLIDLS
ncbi:MAG: hypothetical protein R3C05_26030 [Pirellulaceae bacterium]